MKIKTERRLADLREALDRLRKRDPHAAEGHERELRALLRERTYMIRVDLGEKSP